MDVSTSDIFPQIIYGIVTVAIIYIIYMGVEVLWRTYLAFTGSRVVVYPVTGQNAVTFPQDITTSQSNVKYLPVSQNQVTGIEFSYSTFLYVQDTTFPTTTGTPGWHTAFYKGYASGPFPLCGPAVFIGSDEEGNAVLRVMMNSYASWYNKSDVKQIPINKWFHLAIVLSANNTLNVYINGNLANKLVLEGTIAYQNYQPLNLLPNYSTPAAKASDFDNSGGSQPLRGIPPGENFIILGPMKGYISNVIYYSYAIGYAEILALMDMGPSKQMDTSNMVTPPYLIDTWWTQQKT
jgi:hypothetical protein